MSTPPVLTSPCTITDGEAPVDRRHPPIASQAASGSRETRSSRPALSKTNLELLLLASSNGISSPDIPASLPRGVPRINIRLPSSLPQLRVREHRHSPFFPLSTEMGWACHSGQLRQGRSWPEAKTTGLEKQESCHIRRANGIPGKSGLASKGSPHTQVHDWQTMPQYHRTL